jgi:hypothetical protein
MAHLKTKATTGNLSEREQWKWTLIRGLYDRGLTKEQIVQLFKIIDKMMAKPDWCNSKYFGMTKYEIKELWRKNGAEAATFGTQMHACIENYYNGCMDECDMPEWTYFINFRNDHSHMEPFRTEMMVYDEDIKICGSIDMLFINPDGTLCIYDWKFSKEIQYNSFSGKKVPHVNMEDCNLSHYSLQLNVYRIILERKYGFTIKDMFLVFMHRNLSDNYVKVPVGFIDMDPLIQSRLS